MSDVKSCRLEGFTREARKAPRQHVSHRVADGEGPIAVSLGSVGGKCSEILLVRRDWTSGREKLHSLFAVLFRTSGVPVFYISPSFAFVRARTEPLSKCSAWSRGGIGGRDAGKEARRGPIFGKGTERNELSDASPRSSSPGLSFSSTTTVFLSFIRPFVRFLSHENTAAKRIG